MGDRPRLLRGHSAEDGVNRDGKRGKKWSSKAVLGPNVTLSGSA